MKKRLITFDTVVDANFYKYSLDWKAPDRWKKQSASEKFRKIIYGNRYIQPAMVNTGNRTGDRLEKLQLYLHLDTPGSYLLKSEAVRRVFKNFKSPDSEMKPPSMF